MDVSEVLEARLDRYRATKASTEKRSMQGDSRRVRRASAKEAVVDLVSEGSEVGEDELACRSATGISNLEESQRPKRKRRGGRVDGAVLESRGKEVRTAMQRRSLLWARITRWS